MKQKLNKNIFSKRSNKKIRLFYKYQLIFYQLSPRLQANGSKILGIANAPKL